MIRNAIQQRLSIERFAFLRGDDRALREAFLERANWINLPSGQLICRDGGQCSQLTLLISGAARLYKMGENGREITLYRITPGEACVATAACILSRRPFPAYTVCETDIEAVVVAAAEVRHWLTLSAAWRDFIFTLIADRLGEMFRVLESVLFQPLDQRVANFLLQSLDGVDASAADGRTLHITHQALAAEIGSSREVVTRILHDFERSGALLTGRGRIELIAPGILEDRLRSRRERPRGTKHRVLP